MAVPADGNRSLPSTAGTAPQNRHSALRIVIVNEVFDPDDRSAEAALDRFATLTGWADAVRARGADVLVCQRFHADRELVRSGVAYRFVRDSYPARPSWSYSGSDRLIDAVKSFNPTAVHINGMTYPRAIRRLRASLSPQLAIVVQDHGGFEPRSLPWLRRRSMRRGLAAADAVLVATSAQIEEFRRSGLVPPRVAIRDVMEGSTTFRRLPPAAASAAALNILWVGRLNANKDPLTVLKGFARFAGSRPDATLTFVYGTSELEPLLRAAIRSHDLRGRVILAGSMPHAALESAYSNADLFVLGSHHEGSGYAALEALACGVVPVLTAIPSFRGLTDEGRIGALWEPGDPASLAAALARVTARAPIESQREECRRRFEECFSWEAIGSRAVAIYGEFSAR